MMSTDERIEALRARYEVVSRARMIDNGIIIFLLVAILLRVYGFV